MNLRPLIVLILSALFPATFAFATQDVPPPEKEEAQVQEDDGDELVEEGQMVFPAADMTDHFLQMQTIAVEVEVGKLKSQLGFDEDWGEKIRETLKKDIKEAAERINENNGSMAVSYSNSMDEKLQKKLLKLVAADLPADKKEAFARYKSIEKQFSQLKVDIGIDGVLVFLDQQLCLSQPQFDSLRLEFAKNWDANYNDMGGMTAINGLMGGTQILDVVGEGIWKEVLSGKQQVVFDELDQMSNLMMAMQMSALGGGDDNYNAEKVKILCDQAFDLKFAEYEEMLGLTEKQRRLLSVARKGAAAKVVKRWSKITEEFSGDINGIAMNMELMIEAMEPIVSKCTRQTAWRKTLPKVFNAEQIKKINQRELVRRDLATSQLLNYLVFSMTSQATQLGLDMDQHEKFVELVRSELDSDTVNYMEIIKGLYEIEDAEFKEVLTDEQWEKFRPLYEQQKQMMEQQAEVEDEVEDNEDDN